MSEKLDRALHEAMGKCWHEWKPDGFHTVHFRCRFITCNLWSADGPPNHRYSSDISACLGPGGLVEWMTAQEWFFRFSGGPRLKQVAEFAQYVPTERSFHAEDASLAMAICLAAKEALNLDKTIAPGVVVCSRPPLPDDEKLAEAVANVQWYLEWWHTLKEKPEFADSLRTVLAHVTKQPTDKEAE